jgi:hypothetical protein
MIAAYPQVGCPLAANPRFIFMFVLKLLASVAVIAFITRYYQSSYLIGVVLNWVVLPLISYVAMKLWVFHYDPRLCKTGGHEG